jgi:hypothetical protein
MVLALASSTARSDVPLPVAPPEDAHGVPPEVAEQIRATNGDATGIRMTDFDRAADHKSAVERRNKLFASYRGIVDKFEAAWTEFAARKAIVDKAVADADELVKQNKLDDARALLDGAITRVARDDKGKLPKVGKDRAFIEARDAEVPALLARFKIARTQHDWNAAVDVQANLVARHRIDQDQAAERLLWIAWDRGSQLAGYTASDAKAWARVQIDGAQAAVDGGGKLAGTLDFGATIAMISTAAKLKKGDWVVMPFIDKAKVNKNALSYKEKIDWRVPTECHQSNRISFIDDAGFVHYEDQCSYEYHSETVTLDATLREAMPEWAASYWKGVTIVGKVVSSGPHWKLTDTVVIDTRYRDSM